MLRPMVSDSLSDDEVRIRTDVFVEEQGFVVEFDDDDAISTHIVLYDGDVPAAPARCPFVGLHRPVHRRSARIQLKD